MRKRKICTGILVALLTFSDCVSLMGGAATVQAADGYEIEAWLADVDEYKELTVGENVYKWANVYDRNGRALIFEEEWDFMDYDETAVTIKAPMFYSEYENEDAAARDMVEFDQEIPPEAFGKYIYCWVGAQLVSDPNVIMMKLVRSENQVTDWGETTNQTYALNGDQKTVRVYSVWNLDNDLDAAFKKSIEISGRKYRVTGIGNDILEEAALDIRTVTLHSDIKFITEDAFKGANNLKQVTIQGNVTSIGKGAFSDINKKAVFKIKASKANYKKIVKRIKNSGVAKTVKFKRVK